MWRDLGVAISLLLVLEGIMPFLYPARWRKLVESISAVDDNALRLLGMGCMLTGTVLLYIIN
jgi:uncharacterized protein